MKFRNQPRLFSYVQQPGLFQQTEQSRMYLSQDGVYRHQLEKWWDDQLPRVCFILLNPSTATNRTDDNTTNKLREYAKLWGYGGYILTNIFDFRATDPYIMYAHSQPCSNENDGFIRDAVIRSKSVVCAWGNHGVHLGRGAAVKAMVFEMKSVVHCFRITKMGQPQHPLYLKQETRMEIWKGE